MKKSIILAVFIFLTLSLSVFSLNIECCSSLADFQDNLFKSYEKTSKKNITRLKTNLWIKFAHKLAPGNLVIRHLSLIDLLENKPGNKKKIIKLINTISYDKEDCIWLEGYSYWLYTKPFLEKYADKFNIGEIKQSIECIDLNFVNTAYIRDGKLYPSPFGDLRDVPLEKEFQDSKPKQEASAGPVTKINNTYIIKASPLGMNTHAPKKDSKITVKEGIPQNFEFYKGYNKKYKKPFEEFFDMISLRRLLSILMGYKH